MSIFENKDWAIDRFVKNINLNNNIESRLIVKSKDGLYSIDLFIFRKKLIDILISNFYLR
jgi:hypothetical protein